jgi:sugar phosphate isomerase/epimerase
MAAAVALSCRVPARATARTASERIFRPGLQLAAFRKLLRADPSRLFATVAKLGFRHVELAGTQGHSPSDLRRQLQDAGLLCSSLHVEPAGDAVTLQSPTAVAELAHALGAATIVMPIFLYPHGLPEPAGPNAMDMVRAAGRAMRAADYQRNAQFLNETGEALQGYNLSLAYHNHNVEFAPLGGGCGLEILVAETEPALVHFQLDIGWVAAAGLAPADWVRRLGRRLRSMHLKDISPALVPNTDLRFGYAPIGQGVIDWSALLARTPIEVLNASYMEYENTDDPKIWDDVRADRANILTHYSRAMKLARLENSRR